MTSMERAEAEKLGQLQVLQQRCVGTDRRFRLSHRCVTPGSMVMHLSKLICTASLLVAASAFAHHGWDGYDSSKVMKLEGRIESAGYENPHGTATLKTNDATWHVVLAPPARMTNRGLTREMLAVGTTATVEGYPHRKNAGELRAERITIDGKTVELR